MTRLVLDTGKNAVQDGFSFATNKFRLANRGIIICSSAIKHIKPRFSFSRGIAVLTTGMFFFVASPSVRTAHSQPLASCVNLKLSGRRSCSSTSAPVKGNLKQRSSQQSGWSCHAKERTGSNFKKLSHFTNWFVLNIFFASAAVDSELGFENFVAVFKDFLIFSV